MSRETSVRLSLIVFGLVFFMIVLELKHPYFFLQDDNRTGALPQLAFNWRSLFTHFEFPLVNFHQFLSSPYFALGQPAVLYPPGYLASALSLLFFGHFSAAVDILVTFHLVLAGCGAYLLSRRLFSNPDAAFFAGFAWPLNSFLVYGTNSWWHISAAGAYLPWLLLVDLALFDKPSVKRALWVVFTRIAFFYTGQIQYFIYISLFEVLVVGAWLLFFRKGATDSWRFTGLYAGTFVGTTMAAAPLLLPMWYQTTQSAARGAEIKYEAFASQYYDLTSWLLGLLYPFADNLIVNPWPFRHLHNLSHIGYVTILLILVGTAVPFIRKGDPSSRRIILFMAFAATISFLWASGTINQFVYRIPILNRFRWHFRILLITNFFFVLLGVAGLEWILRRFARSATQSFLVVLVAASLFLSNMSYLYVTGPIRSFNSKPHADRLPLEEAGIDLLGDSRIVSVGLRPEDPYSAKAVGFNYATLWGLYHFAGYDPLVSKAHADAALGLNFNALFNREDLPLSYFREWGVGRYIVLRSELDRQVEESYAEAFQGTGFTRIMEEAERFIFADPGAPPIIRWKDGSSAGLKSSIRANSLTVTSSSPEEGDLLLSFLYSPFYRAYLDDSRVIDVNHTDLGQILVTIPAGEHTLTLYYSDPYFLYGVAILVVFLLLMAAGYVYSYKIRKSLRLGERAV